MYTNVLEQNSKRVSRESRDRVLGNLNQQETEEIVVYTWVIHGLSRQCISRFQTLFRKSVRFWNFDKMSSQYLRPRKV